jgi:hypothetical protein
MLPPVLTWGLVKRNENRMGVSWILVGDDSNMGASEIGISFGKTRSVKELCEDMGIKLLGVNGLHDLTLDFMSLCTASADFPYNPGQGQAIRNGVNRNSAIIGGR